VQPASKPATPTAAQKKPASHAVQTASKKPAAPKQVVKAQHERPADRKAAPALKRSYHRSSHHQHPGRVRDARYNRPSWRHVRHYPHAAHGPPRFWWYRSWYSHWWVHPHYRYRHASFVVVSFDFVVSPWVVTWAPPARTGWVWVPGHWEAGVWVPGHWRPVAAAPVVRGAHYAYVAGWWAGDVYIEGHWRLETRSGWTWVDGYYADTTYIRGHWHPEDAAPVGYTWVPGFFDGEIWVEGFWRPAARDGFVWVDGSFDADGVYLCGYWEPVVAEPGSVWIPGWFDGHEWQEGYWVDEAEYSATDLDTWEPEEGYDDGWEEEVEPEGEDGEPLPLALPVEFGEEE